MIQLQNAEVYIQKKVKDMEKRERILEQMVENKNEEKIQLKSTYQEQIVVYKQAIMDLQEAYLYQQSLSEKIEALHQYENFCGVEVRIPPDEV